MGGGRPHRHSGRGPHLFTDAPHGNAPHSAGGSERLAACPPPQAGQRRAPWGNPGGPQSSEAPPRAHGRASFEPARTGARTTKSPGAPGCAQQERAAGPRGGPAAAPHIRVPRRRTHLPGARRPPAPGSGCAISSPDHHACPAAAPPSCPSQSAPACPTRRLHQPAAHCHGPFLRRHRTDQRSTRAPPPWPRARAPPRLASQQPSLRPARRWSQSPTPQRPLHPYGTGGTGREGGSAA